MIRFFLLLTAAAINSPVVAQTHFVNTHTNSINRMGAGGEGAIHVDYPVVRGMLEFTASPSGRLMYVEDLDTTARLSLEEAYNGFRNSHRDSYLSRVKQPYDPERITTRLHITDPEGKDLIVVPMPDKLGRYWVNGRFLNEQLVSFAAIDRNDDLDMVTIVNLKNKKAWSVGMMERFRRVEVGILPNSESFFVALRNPEDRQRLLFLNGNLVMPYFDAAPPLPSDAPDDFDKHWARLRDSFKLYFPDGFDFSYEPETLCSSDGKYLTVLATPGMAEKSAGALAEPTALILDRQKIGPGKDFRDYSFGVPLRLPSEQMQQLRTASGDTTAPLSHLRPRLDLSANKIVIEDTTQQPPLISIDLPLPADWRDQTIRQSAK